MRTRLLYLYTAAAVMCMSAAAAAAQKSEPAKSGGDNQPAPIVMLVPVEISDPAMQSGCWAQLYGERNFKGDMFTVVGPMSLEATDKAGARQIHRNLDSLVTGPKATLTVFEHKLFKDKSVKFGPNSKEAGLVKKLGFTGRIESMKLECGS